MDDRSGLGERAAGVARRLAAVTEVHSQHPQEKGALSVAARKSEQRHGCEDKAEYDSQ